MHCAVIQHPRLRPLWLAAALLLGPSTLFGAVELYGRVVDENGTPVAGVRIELQPESGAERSVAVSDPTGTFSVRVEPGSYLLTAEPEGFFRIEARRVLFTNHSEALEIVAARLQQTSESINVSATAPGVDRQDTTSERQLTGRQIIDVPYPATRDFRNALRVIPGVLRHPSGRMTFDGGMENQIFYTLNGFNISDPISGRFTTRLPVESVRTVEYASGRYSAEFGKGSAGALAIQTTNGDDKFRYSATNFVPGIETQKGLHIGTWSPRLNVSGPIRRGKAWFSDSIDTEYSMAVVPDLPKGQDRTARWRGTNVLHSQINLTPSQMLTFNVLASYEHAPRTGLTALDPISTSVDRSMQQLFASVRHQKYFTRGMVLEGGYARTSSRADERPQGYGFYIITPDRRDGHYFLDSTQRSHRDQLVASLFAPSFTAIGTHQVKTGIDIDVVHLRQIASRTGYEHHDRRGRLLTRTTFGGAGSFALRNAQAAAYIVDLWRVRRDLTVEYGIRQDRDQLVNRPALSPRFAVSYARGDTRISGGFAVVHDASALSIFARALDQHAITARFDGDGAPEGIPWLTFFRAPGSYYAPQYRNLSLGFEHRVNWRLKLSANVLRRRGSRGFTYLAGPGELEGVTAFELTNLRRDVYDSASVTLHHNFGSDYSWMVNYVRSRALSNAVIDLSVDQPLQVANNLGRLSWDAPHRVLSWGYLPGWSSNWAIAYLLDARSGFPFSLMRDTGEVVGAVNSMRFPINFGLNVHLERKFRLGRYRFAIRAGLNNVTNTMNASGVNNVIDSPNFLQYYGREGRHGVFRLRWLKQGE